MHKYYFIICMYWVLIWYSCYWADNYHRVLPLVLRHGHRLPTYYIIYSSIGITLVPDLFTLSLRFFSVITTFLHPSTTFIQQLFSLVIHYPSLDVMSILRFLPHYPLFSSFDSSNFLHSAHIYKRLPSVHPYICSEHKFSSVITVV